KRAEGFATDEDLTRTPPSSGVSPPMDDKLRAAYTMLMRGTQIWGSSRTSRHYPCRCRTCYRFATQSWSGRMKTHRERMLAGELYGPTDPELAEARARARELCQALNASSEARQAERRHILRRLLGSGGDTVVMQPPFFCDYGVNIELGERVFFNFNCVVVDVCKVRVGSFTRFGPAVQIYTPLHPMNAEMRRGEEYGKPVDIGLDVWVGGGVIILPGVRI